MGCSASSGVNQSSALPRKETKETTEHDTPAEKVTGVKHKSTPANELVNLPQKKIKEKFLDQTKPTKGKSDYLLNPTGIYEKSLDFRSQNESPRKTTRPKPIKRLWDDPDFDPEIITNNNVEWIRPKYCGRSDDILPETDGFLGQLPETVKNYCLDNNDTIEYCKSPKLFVGGFGRQDIQQGCIGDCYFLAFISGLSERPDLMSKVIPYDAYLVERPDYDGIFHCRFWKFGQWEDVYIDDYIPTIYTRESIVSARSVEKNEMWVTLLEKAFAKFCGGYQEIENDDLIMDAHRCLTGGMSEMIHFQNKQRKPNPTQVFKRIENSLLRANTSIAASVGEASDGIHGLEGDHAFSVTGTARAKLKSGEEVPLVCLRNPWGGTEWSGPWSESSSEWDKVVSGVHRPEDDAGEFYICINDLCKYFNNCTICDLTPDINGDGTGEEFEYLTSIYAEWKGGSVAGRTNVLQNSKLVFNVPDDGVDETGSVPLGLSLVQPSPGVDEQTMTIGIQLYQVFGEKDGALVVEQIFECSMDQIQIHGGKRVKPGKYMVVVFSDPAKESQCLIRIFTMGPLSDTKPVPSSWDIMTTPAKEKPVSLHDINCNLDFKEALWGEWTKDINLGGQICETMFGSNPQLELVIPESGEDKQAVKFQLFKGSSSHELVLGLRIFKLSDNEQMPRETNWFWDKEQYNLTIKSTDGKTEGWEWNYIQPAYVLSPGRYCAILYHSDETVESSFCVIIKSANKLQITSYQMDKDHVEVKERKVNGIADDATLQRKLNALLEPREEELELVQEKLPED